MCTTIRLTCAWNNANRMSDMSTPSTWVTPPQSFKNTIKAWMCHSKYSFVLLLYMSCVLFSLYIVILLPLRTYFLFINMKPLGGRNKFSSLNMHF